jgi:2-haloacid dehalogenase
MLDFNRFRVLTFDCYGTLIDWETGILSTLHRILAAHGKKVDDSTLLKLFGDFEVRAEQGQFQPYRQVLQSVVRQFGEELGFIPTDHETRSLPESLASWKPWPDTVRALRQLKQRFHLAIISNVDDDLFAATLPKLEVEFSQIITAEQAQAYKPSQRIFEVAIGRIGLPARAILHSGQSVYHDVIPAQSLGLSTVWVNRPSARKGIGAVIHAEGSPDLELSSLAELAARVAQSHSDSHSVI